MPSVTLTEEDWAQVLSLLADAPWKIANPLLMRIGDQLRAQKIAEQMALTGHDPNIKQQTNSKETVAAEGLPASREVN